MAKQSSPPTVVATAMSSEQQGILQNLQRLLDATSHELDWHHQIGTQVAAWGKASPGQSWRQHLPQALGTSKERLQKDHEFASKYTQPNEVEQLAALGCSWVQVEAVLRLANNKTRLRLLKAALKNNWSLAELKAVVQKEKGQAPHAGGRPLRKPATAELGLQQLQTLGSKLLKFFEDIWQGDEAVLKRLEQLPAENVSDALLQDFQAAQEIMSQLAAAASEAENDLMRMAMMLKDRAAQ